MAGTIQNLVLFTLFLAYFGSGPGAISLPGLCWIL